MELTIGRLSTRLRPRLQTEADGLASGLRAALAGPLPGALDAAVTKALAEAGLPAEAFVAVRRLDLRLRTLGTPDAAALAAGWGRALTNALLRALGRGTTGDGSAGTPDEDLVCLPDLWSAETRYLAALAEDHGPPWWAHALPGRPAGTSARSGPPPAAILSRWLDEEPARAIATMAQLIEAHPSLVGLVPPDDARGLAAGLLASIQARLQWLPGPIQEATATAEGPEDAELSARRGDSDQRGWPADALQTLTARIAAGLPGALAAAPTLQRRPWVLAVALATQPGISRLPPQMLRRLLADLEILTRVPRSRSSEAEPTSAAMRERDGGQTITATPSKGPGPTGDMLPALGGAAATASAIAFETFAGGLLLLLRPMVRLEVLPPGPADEDALGDLALLALRTVLSPLPAGERTVAEERERPLLSVLAPRRDWRAKIHEAPIARPEAAAARLARLSAEIPADIAAPFGLRRVFGGRAVGWATDADRRLAYLVLRPGELHVDDWHAELTWPLASIDLALRRAGWDQDPGWIPWLGRVVRLRFGDAP